MIDFFKDLSKYKYVFLDSNKEKFLSRYFGKLKCKLNGWKVENFYRKEGEPKGRVLISYLVEPFYIDKQSKRFSQHSNLWQALEIAKSFNELGYVVDIFQYDKDVEPSSFDEYDIVFGHDPNFEKYIEKVKGATKIFYSPGMHPEQRNKAEIERVASFNERKNADMEPERLLPQTNSIENSDYIITVGESGTVESFEKRTDPEKVYNVRVSTFDFLDLPKNKNYDKARKNFLYFSGGGLLLKGTSLYRF